MDTYVYHIDRDNRLTAVSANWDDFLRANEGDASSASAAVTGRSLFDFFSGPDTPHLYHLLLKKVRRSGSPAAVLLNCDSPATRRQMRLSIHPAAGDAVVFRSTVLAIVPREPADLLKTGPRSETFVTICSFCKKLALPEQVWVDVETFLHLSSPFTQDDPPRLTHGVCPACYADAVEQIVRLG